MFEKKFWCKMVWVHFLITVSGLITACYGNVIVYENLTSISFEDRPATFGIEIPQNGLSGRLLVAKPLNACVPIERAPHNGPQFFVLILESECTFGEQVMNAQLAGYQAAIIYNKESDELKLMAGGEKGRDVFIASVFVGKSAGKELKKFTYKTGSTVVITPILGPPLLIYLVPFVIVVGLCFLFMAVFTIVRYYRHRVRVRRSRLTPANLKKIPCKKFKKGEVYDVCAICLDEYQEGDKLRILPCEHVYHCKCVDPWLLEGKRTCPVCKQSVDPDKGRRRRRSRRSYGMARPDSDEEINEDENETETQPSNDVIGQGITERTPLIQGSRSGSRTERCDAPMSV